jgi:hypothetical protein
MLQSDWMTAFITVDENPVQELNVQSIVPSEFSLTILFALDQLYVVNAPYTIIFQSDCDF